MPEAFGSRRITLIFADDPAKFWTVDVESSQRVLAVEDRAIGGDFGNMATLLPQLYYSRRPVRELLPLAVVTIMLAHECNPTFVGGLDVVVFEKGQIIRLSEEDLKPFKARFVEFDEGIARALGNTVSEVKKWRPISQ